MRVNPFKIEAYTSLMARSRHLVNKITHINPHHPTSFSSLTLLNLAHKLQYIHYTDPRFRCINNIHPYNYMILHNNKQKHQNCIDNIQLI